MRRLSLAALTLGALSAARPAAAQQPVLDFSSANGTYFDAINAAAASQMLGAPAPLLRGSPGQSRFSLSLGYVQVDPRPLEFSGASLSAIYSRLLRGPWGAYGALFGTWLRSSETSDSGAPHPDLLTHDISGLNGAAYSGTHAAGATVANFSAGAGLTYRVRDRPGVTPVTFFAGPFATRISMQDTDYRYAVTGTENNGTSYRLDGERRSSIDLVYGGAVIGMAAEFRMGRAFAVIPRIYQVFMRLASEDVSTTVRHRELCGGVPCGDSTYAFGPGGRRRIFFFPVPGLDVVYRDWGLSLNILEPITGWIARPILTRARQGQWPLTLRLTKHFGNYEK